MALEEGNWPNWAIRAWYWAFFIAIEVGELARKLPYLLLLVLAFFLGRWSG